MIRDDIKAALVQSMKARNEARTSAIRLIQAAIKNKDIELRTGAAPTDDDALIIDVLQKMAKQRRESIEMFDKGGRAELADAERAELALRRANGHEPGKRAGEGGAGVVNAPPFKGGERGG